ncbi:MAG: nucleotidyltransferase [Clostridia bacterium]|nr:nucleotidyltransferase [Clostridia bacterium]
MKKVLGIIAEYNPFHNGHLYHLNKSKELSKAEFSIAVIGGNFTQRGEPSIIDKWSKAKMALLNGVDLVLELPVLYATSSAENFADGAIRLLDSLGIVDDLYFGAENANIHILNDFAEILYKEPREYKVLLAEELKKGLSFPSARENALMMYLNNSRQYANVLSSPNNILGIEYIKALKKNKSLINPIALDRTGVYHNEIEYSGNMASATAIRNSISIDLLQDAEPLMPKHSFSIIKKCIKDEHIVKNLSAYEKEIIYSLRRMSLSEISNLQDVSEGLENLIKKAVNSSNNLDEIINSISSKRYTKTRISRILLYSLLGITKKDIQLSKKTLPYARILGYNKNGKFLISEIVRVNPKIEFVASVKKYADECTNKNLQVMLDKDILATNVYTLGYKNNSKGNLDFTKRIVSV